MPDISELSDEELDRIAGSSGAAGHDITQLSDDELNSIAGEQPNDAQDIMKSLASGTVKGAVSMPFAVGDVGNLTTQGMQKAYEYYRDVMALRDPQNHRPMTTQQERLLESQKPFYGSQEILAPVQDKLGVHFYEPKTTGGDITELIGNILGGGIATATAPKAFDRIAGSRLMSEVGSGTNLPSSIDDLISSQGSGRPPPPPGGAGSVAANPPRVSADEFKALSQTAYGKAEEVGGVLNENFTNKALDELSSRLPKEELDVMVSQNNPIVKLAEQVAGKRGKPTTLNEAQKFDEHLTQLIDGEWGKSGLSKAGKEIQDYQSKFREMVENAAEGDIAGGAEGFNALKEGRHYWSQYRRMSDIEKIMTRAALTDNPAISMKAGFRNLYMNKAAMRGFNDSEKALIKRAAEGNMTVDTLRILGSRLNPIIAGAAGGGLSGATLAHVGSMAARNLATKAQVARGLKIADEIARRPKPIPTEIIPPKPKQLTYQPKERDISVDWEGNAARLSDAEQATIDAARERAQSLGLSPDVIAAQEQHLINKMMQERGQSELGKFAVENRNRPITTQKSMPPTTEYSQAQVDKLLRGSAWDKITAEQKSQISSQVEKLWGSQQVPIDDMINAAKQRAEDMAAAVGEPVKNTSMMDAFLNLGKSTSGQISPKAAAVAGAGALGGLSLNRNEGNAATKTPPTKPKYDTMEQLLDDVNKQEKLRLKDKPQSSNVPQSFQSEEGLKTRVYKDTTGNRTVGVGFNMDSGIARDVWKQAGIKKDFNAVRNGKQDISEMEAQRLLNKSYEIAHDDIKALVPNITDLTKKQQEAATHLAFQHGRSKLKESLPGVLAMLKQGNPQGAAARLLASDYGKKYRNRATRLAKMLIGA